MAETGPTRGGVAKTLTSVLLVDDYEPDIVYAELILNHSGRCKHILKARSADEALELYKNYNQSRQQHPDAFPPLLILLDINMPRMNGFEFLDVWEGLDKPDAPAAVVMLSSSFAAAERSRSESYGTVRGFLTKPLNPTAVEELADSFGVP